MWAFYKRVISYNILAWKAMTPGLSDMLATIFLGVVILKVASITLITVLTLNVALKSYCSLLLMHNLGRQPKEQLLSHVLQAALLLIIIFIGLAATAQIVFEGTVGRQSQLFLLLSLGRPLLLGFATYCTEVLIHQDQRDILHRTATKAIIVYAMISWGLLSAIHFGLLEASILWLLCAVYVAQIYVIMINVLKLGPSFIPHLQDGRVIVKNLLVIPYTLPGIRAAVSAAITNILELGFLAVAGWVVVMRFDHIAPYYFPLFNLFEWGSGFGIGLWRVRTERLIAGEMVPKLTLPIVILIVYCILFVILCMLVMQHITPIFDRIGWKIIVFAICYILFDSLQLLLRANDQARTDGGVLLPISLGVYSISGVALATATITGSSIGFMGALLLPTVLASLSLAVTSSR